MVTTPSPNLSDAVAQLHDGEIHVWCLDYHRALGRSPLLGILAAYLRMDAADVMLLEGPHGRPQLAPSLDSSLGFNWSHSGDKALVAVARGITPGVDLEKQRPRPNALAIAQRFFRREEAAALAQLDGDARGLAFLELWTAKEAVTKALGRGIGFGLDRLSFSGAGEYLQLQQLDGEDIAQWQLRRLAPAPGLVGALAWRGTAREIRLGMLASGA